MKNRTLTDADDLFADSRMSFGDHIEELRVYLWRAIIGFFAIVILCFAMDGIGVMTETGFGVGAPAMRFISKPVVDALQDFYDRRVEKVRARLKQDPHSIPANQPSGFVKVSFLREQFEAVNKGKSSEELDKFPMPDPKQVNESDLVKLWTRIEEPVLYAAELSRAEREVGKRPDLSTLSVTEAFVVYIKVALVCGIVLSSPWVFWQIWSFIAAGLYPHEKRYVNVYLPFSLLLFLTGVVFCELAVLPQAVKALLWFNEWLDLEPELRLNEWLSFAIWLPIIFGISFQTPLVMLFLERLGIMNVETYRNKRRISWFALACFAAVVTPTDLLSMLFLWVPMCGLYELGILLCQLSPRHESGDMDVPEPEEMVEV